MSTIFCIITSKKDQIRNEYHRDAERKEAVVNEYVTNYPLASWDDVTLRLQIFGNPNVAESARAVYTGEKVNLPILKHKVILRVAKSVNSNIHVARARDSSSTQCGKVHVNKPVWIVTVDHRLKSDQHVSIAAQTAPGWTYGRLTIACQYTLQCTCVLILLADSGQ